MKFLKLFHGGSKSLTEADLLQAYRQTGELRLVGELYQPFMQMVFSICYKHLQDEEESKDAVMSIFEKLITDLKTYEVGNFKSWLHTVARNHCLMQIRSKKAFVTMDALLRTDEEMPENDFSEESDQIQLNGNLTALEKCMGTLNMEQKTSIDLFYIQEKCYQEISEQTGFEYNKVKSYIQNGKRNLKICMDKNGKR